MVSKVDKKVLKIYNNKLQKIIDKLEDARCDLDSLMEDVQCYGESVTETLQDLEVAKDKLSQYI
jgi:hypothetical protein